MSSPLRDAYRDALRVRRATGDRSADVLTLQLRKYDVGAVWLDLTSELHEWLFTCWERGYGRRRLTLEASKKMASLLPIMVRPLVDLVRAFR